MARKTYKLALMVLVFSVCFSNFSFAAKKIVVELWEGCSPPCEAALRSTIEDFHHLNPNIRIDRHKVSFGRAFEKMMVAVAAGAVPDCTPIWAGFINQFADMGVLEPLDKFGAEEWKNQLYPGAWDYGTYKGQAYGLAYAMTPRYIVYNKRMFEKAGIQRVPETWEEFREAARKTTVAAEGIHGYVIEVGGGIQSAQHYSNWLWINGGDFFNEDQTKCLLDSEEAIEALQFMVDLVKDGSAMPVLAGGELSVRDIFIIGKTAMVHDGPWIVREMATRAPDMKFGKDWGIFPIPVPKAGMKKVNHGSVGAYVMYKGHKAPAEAAYKVITWIAPGRFRGIHQLLCGQTSARLDTVDEFLIRWIFPENHGLIESQKLLADSRVFPKHAKWSEIVEQLLMQQDLALAGKLSAAEAQKKATKQINSLLK